MSNGKPFKARLGLDANNEKVVNVAQPEVGTDVVNLDYFNNNNTVQQFSSLRGYPANYLVEFSDRLWKARSSVPAGNFDQSMWTEIHAFGRWIRVTGAYNAEPGDNLLVSTQTASFAITLPAAEDGDIVSVIDEGYASTNPITVNATAATINGSGSTYQINSKDYVRFIYTGGTWKVDRMAKGSTKVVTANTTAIPNSTNIVNTQSSQKTVTLPATPVDGQYVNIVDGTGNAAVYPVTIAGNGNTIGTAAAGGTSSYTISRNSEQVTLVWSALDTKWVMYTTALQSRMKDLDVVSTIGPNEKTYVALDSSTKTFTLPTSAIANDWVEVITTLNDESATGSVVVNAGGARTFTLNGSGQTSTSFRIKRRCRTIFVLKGTQWHVIQSEDNGVYAGVVSVGTLSKNSLYVVNGSASDTVYLPPRDSLQVGDYVRVKVAIGAGTRVLFSVNNVTDEIITGGGTTITYAEADTNIVLTFAYAGWDGSKFAWVLTNEGVSYLKKTDNLASLADKGVSRTNLDVFSKGESDARFLPINGTADNAAQAANADKLDNLDSTDFIQVKNPSTVAVDANTTTETRFTTNLNTPNGSESWQVVNFIDKATGDKSQLAMGISSNKIGFRSYTGSTWSAWSLLDQSANAATASKLAAARTIALAGDATGSVAFDGSGNVTINTTVESAAVNLEDLSVAYASMKDGVFVDKSDNFTHFLAKDGNGTGLGIKIDNTTGQGVLAYWNGTAWITSNLYTDSYHPSADKWTTARTITFTGGITGSASIDGSGDVSIATTVDAGAHTHVIADVTGLQAALDGKLGATAKAADSELLDGVNGADYSKAVAGTNSGEDPNTTTTELILTNHANTPDGGTSYWYIETKYYQTRSAASNRFQFASQYNSSVTVQFRQYYAGAWSDWAAVAAIIDGATYNINVSGNAATADSAAQATKLETARTINGVAFDGTGNITIADDTKLAKTGGTLTGQLSITTAGNAAIELGRIDGVASTPFIDFHSGATAVDFDVRLIASGGTGAVGQGDLTINALNTVLSGSLDLPGTAVLDGTTNGLQITNGANGTVTIGNRNTSYTHYQSSAVSGHYFYGNVTVQTALAAPTITASGAVSAGSLSVNGGAFSSSGSTHTFNSWVRTSGQTGWFAQDYGGGMYMIDTTWMRVYNGKALYVANEIAATGNITAYYSDARLKENLKPIPNALDAVRSWTGYTYNANVTAQSFGYDPNKKEIGLLAQDVQKTTPEAVEPAPFDRHAIKGKSLTGKHYLTLKYDRLVPVLVEAIKEQDKEIQELKEQVQFLMEEFKKLKS